MTLIFSKQRNRLLIHERGDLRLYLTKISPNISKLCEGCHSKHIHHTELGTMVCIDFFKKNCLKILPWVCCIRLGGGQSCVESEKGAIEQKSLRNTDLELQQASYVYWLSRWKQPNVDPHQTRYRFAY